MIRFGKQAPVVPDEPESKVNSGVYLVLALAAVALFASAIAAIFI